MKIVTLFVVIEHDDELGFRERSREHFLYETDANIYLKKYGPKGYYGRIQSIEAYFDSTNKCYYPVKSKIILGDHSAELQEFVNEARLGQIAKIKKKQDELSSELARLET
jgi:hypothetical protein